LVLFVGIGRAENFPSPNGAYVLEIGKGVQILDRSHHSVLTVISDLAAIGQQVEAKWSPDSRKIAIVGFARRGSAIYAAYLAGEEWHKAVEQDDLPTDELARQGGVSGRLVAEQRRLGHWLDADRITISGRLTFSNQKQVPYGYTLVFGGAVQRVDRGGYEEGPIKGVDFHVR
jgi:hypothetical protein